MNWGELKQQSGGKISEIRESQRIERICQYAREKKSMQKWKLGRVKHKVKRKFRGGM